MLKSKQSDQILLHSKELWDTLLSIPVSITKKEGNFVMAGRKTIQDIAERAGVSQMTVSRVLNNRPDVAPATRKRIEEVIKELDYRPSELARGLRSKRTKTIGLIVPDSSNPFFAEIAKGVEDEGYEAGYSVILCNSAKMPERELKYLDLLQAKGVDGIIFITTTTQIDQIRPLIDHGIPVVMFYRDPGDLNVDTFKIDNYSSGYLATRHLADLGHQNIACIRPGSTETPSAKRVDGYKQALEDCGLSWNPDLMRQGDNLLSGGERAARQLLEGEYSFSAIFACNDAMAIGAMRALRSYGYRIPEDISVVGIDDIILASYAEPALTTVAQPKEAAGHQAVQYLIQRIEGDYNGGPRKTVLETKLITRASCTQFKPSKQV
jgi:LacI family transcriptional regulator